MDIDTIDLNCDMGEGFGTYTIGADEVLMDYITSANVACGYHAGDPLVINRTVELASNKRLCIGAHPGFPDLMGFGRRPMMLTPLEIESYVLYQIGAVAGFTGSYGRNLSHVKPHGSLYNMAAEKKEVAAAVIKAIFRFSKDLIVVGPPRSMLETMANEFGLRYAREGFVDRAYNVDGSLVSRSISGSTIHDANMAAEQAVQMVKKGTVKTITGEIIELETNTLCIHGDSPSAPAIVRAVRDALEKAEIRVAPITSFLQ